MWTPKINVIVWSNANSYVEAIMEVLYENMIKPKQILSELGFILKTGELFVPTSP